MTDRVATDASKHPEGLAALRAVASPETATNEPDGARIAYAAPTESQVAIKDDLMNGVPEIAEFFGWPERRVYYEAEPERVAVTGIPLFRIGSRIHGFRTSCAAWLRSLEQKAVAG